MQGKRTKKSIWTLSRLVPLALLLAAVILLPSISGMRSQPPAEPPSVETPEPPVEELPVEEPPAVEELPEPESEPEPYPNPDKPMIALTFDDGPGSYTDRLLDVFVQHGGKGTFFMVGRYISSFPDTVRRMAEEGHELANHSWNHSDLTKLTAAKITEEIVKTREKLLEVTGVETRLVRLPYGSTNQKVRTVAGETGSTLVRWSVDPQDWKFRDAEIVYNAVMSRVKDGSIVLVHDIHATTIDAMERLIPDLQAAGYQLVTVSELLEYRYEETAPQIVYPPEPEPEPEPEPPAPTPEQPAEPTPAPETPVETAPAEPEALPPATPDTAAATQTPTDPAAVPTP